MTFFSCPTETLNQRWPLTGGSTTHWLRSSSRPITTPSSSCCSALPAAASDQEDMACVVESVVVQRPWLALYNVRLRPRPLTEEQQVGVRACAQLNCLHASTARICESVCMPPPAAASYARQGHVVWVWVWGGLVLRSQCLCCMAHPLHGEISATGLYMAYSSPAAHHPLTCQAVAAAAALQSELGLIQRVLTDELMHTILSHLGPYSLGRVACVCQQWRQFAEVRTGRGSQAQAPAAAAGACAKAYLPSPSCTASASCCMPSVSPNSNLCAPSGTHCAAGTSALAGSQPGGIWAVPQGRALLLRARAAAVQVRRTATGSGRVA